MLERQAEGTAKARAEGRYKGRPKSASLLASEARQMVAGGKTATEQPRRSALVGRASTGRWRPLRARAHLPTSRGERALAGPKAVSDNYWQNVASP